MVYSVLEIFSFATAMKKEQGGRTVSFLEAYKHLEKLCGEVFGDDKCISAYIDEMTQISRGSYVVGGWDEDLRHLKHYRWVRNRIVHDPDCTEQNMCAPEDAVWLEKFYQRIMNQTDPLALYAQATKPQPKAKPAQESALQWDSYTPPAKPKAAPRKSGVVPALVIGAAILLAFFVFTVLLLL